MSVTLRAPKPSDAPAISRIVYEAFKTFAESRNFEPDFPSLEAVEMFATAFMTNPKIWGIVAERDGRVVGSNFLTERNAIRGVGPITIDPSAQGQKIGRRLMEAAIERGEEAKGIRLVQDAHNTISISLYASLGFEVKEPLFLMRGKPKSAVPSDVTVRAMTPADFPACAALCQACHGFDRTGELQDVPPFMKPMVAVRQGKIVAYASAPSMWPLNHGVAQTDEDLQALLLGAGAASADPLFLLVPARRSDFFRWCLEEGLRIQKPMSLMSMGSYQEPKTAFYPSVEY